MGGVYAFVGRGLQKHRMSEYGALKAAATGYYNVNRQLAGVLNKWLWGEGIFSMEKNHPFAGGT